MARAVHQHGEAVLGVGFPVEIGGKADQRLEARLGGRQLGAAHATQRRPRLRSLASRLFLLHPRRELTRRRAGCKE
jgi:hypothetical protein